MYRSEWKKAKLVGTIRCWSFFVTADNEIHTQHFLLLPFQCLRHFILPLRAELWRVFSLRQKTFFAGWFAEETTQTSAITITRAYEVRSHVKNAQLQY